MLHYKCFQSLSKTDTLFTNILNKPKIKRKKSEFLTHKTSECSPKLIFEEGQGNVDGTYTIPQSSRWHFIRSRWLHSRTPFEATTKSLHRARAGGRGVLSHGNIKRFKVLVSNQRWSLVRGAFSQEFLKQQFSTPSSCRKRHSTYSPQMLVSVHTHF